MVVIMFTGISLAVLGAALSAILAGIGSAAGVQTAGRAAAGVVSEKPELFGKVFLLQALPGTQGIYGFLAAILLLGRVGLIGGGAAELSTAAGWQFLFASLPIAIVGLISGIFQGRTAAAAIHMVARQPESSVKGLTMTALVETYAILALLVSILLLYGIQI